MKRNLLTLGLLLFGFEAFGQVTLPHDFTASVGSPISASEVMANFNALVSGVNGNVNSVTSNPPLMITNNGSAVDLSLNFDNTVFHINGNNELSLIPVTNQGQWQGMNPIYYIGKVGINTPTPVADLEVKPNFSYGSGVESGVVIGPTSTQTGYAGYTALLVDVTENGTSTGPKKLLDLKVNGTSKFSVDANGEVKTSKATFIGGIGTSYFHTCTPNNPMNFPGDFVGPTLIPDVDSGHYASGFFTIPKSGVYELFLDVPHDYTGMENGVNVTLNITSSDDPLKDEIIRLETPSQVTMKRFMKNDKIKLYFGYHDMYQASMTFSNKFIFGIKEL